MIDAGTVVLFALFLITMLALARMVFRFDDSLRKAGYVFATVSSLLATVLLTNSPLLVDSLPALGAAGWLLVAIGAVPVLLLALVTVFLGLKIFLWAQGSLGRWRGGDALDDIWPQHHFSVNFDHHAIPQPHFAPAQPTAQTGGDRLQVSDVGREQIRQLIEIDRATPSEKSRSGEFGSLPVRRHRWPVAT